MESYGNTVLNSLTQVKIPDFIFKNEQTSDIQ